MQGHLGEGAETQDSTRDCWVTPKSGVLTFPGPSFHNSSNNNTQRLYTAYVQGSVLSIRYIMSLNSHDNPERSMILLFPFCGWFLEAQRG
jgi:hypothetical protein